MRIVLRDDGCDTGTVLGRCGLTVRVAKHGDEVLWIYVFAFNLCCYLHLSKARGRIQYRMRAVVSDMGLGTRDHIDLTEDAGHAKLVLILQIAAHTPLQDEDGQAIDTRLRVGCDVEFRRGVRDLAEADKFAVYPDVEVTVDAFEIQIAAAPGLFFRQVEVGQIGATRILLGDIRRIVGEGITNIRVLVV